uniref:adenylate kinase n=1 Tax=Ananas comosus var. bracteatus TaxID=296719 RepID=A0A6V7PIG4_ANACO|nr:unnamed protein product [Ananas comosus var. bracteatus]
MAALIRSGDPWADRRRGDGSRRRRRRRKRAIALRRASAARERRRLGFRRDGACGGCSWGAPGWGRGPTRAASLSSSACPTSPWGISSATSSPPRPARQGVLILSDSGLFGGFSMLSPHCLRLAGIVNQGKLVPDEIIVNLLSEHLKNGEAKGESGFILDGFPRTIRQAEILEGVADIDLVINLKLREEALLMKCLGRRICRECGGNFNVSSVDIKGGDGRPHIYMPQILPPEQCLSKLVIREDDADEKVVKTRLRIYFDVTQPVEEFYRSRGKLLEFDLPGESLSLGESYWKH